MGKVKGQGHTVGQTTYLLTKLSFHINQPSYSWDTAISQFDQGNLTLKIQVQGHG